MSDDSLRSPPPLPRGRRASTGNFKAQGPKPGEKTDAGKPDASKPDANTSKTDAVKLPGATRQRTRSGAMRATTRPDNPLAAFKARAEQTPVEAPAPPVPHAPPRVPPPAPRTPPHSPPPHAGSNRSLPALTPPVLPHRREAAAEVSVPPPLPAPSQAPQRLDITVSAVPHPRLQALTPIEPTPTALTVALPTPKEPESAPHELPQPVTTTSIVTGTSLAKAGRAPHRRRIAALASAAVLGALGVGGWFATGGSQRAWPKATADAAALAAPTPPEKRAPNAAPAAPAPTPAPAKASTPSEPVLSKPGASDANIPWLDGTEPDGCLPAEAPAQGVALADLARSQQQQTKGRQLLMQGKLEASLSALCEAARLNPAHSGIAFEVARAALIARHPVTAARFAERSLALTPPDRRSKELLADALAWQGNIEAARSEWFGIHKLSAPTPKTFENLHLGATLEARTALKQGDYAQAERFLRRALAFDPESVGTTTQLARVLLLAGQPKAAQAWITRALGLDANDAERYVLAGDIQEALGDRSAANHHYSRALELDPKHGVAKLRVQKQAL